MQMKMAEIDYIDIFWEWTILILYLVMCFSFTLVIIYVTLCPVLIIRLLELWSEHADARLKRIRLKIRKSCYRAVGFVTKALKDAVNPHRRSTEGRPQEWEYYDPKVSEYCSSTSSLMEPQNQRARVSFVQGLPLPSGSSESKFSKLLDSSSTSYYSTAKSSSYQQAAPRIRSSFFNKRRASFNNHVQFLASYESSEFRAPSSIPGAPGIESQKLFPQLLPTFPQLLSPGTSSGLNLKDITSSMTHLEAGLVLSESSSRSVRRASFAGFRSKRFTGAGSSRVGSNRRHSLRSHSLRIPPQSMRRKMSISRRKGSIFFAHKQGDRGASTRLSPAVSIGSSNQTLTGNKQFDYYTKKQRLLDGVDPSSLGSLVATRQNTMHEDLPGLLLKPCSEDDSSMLYYGSSCSGRSSILNSPHRIPPSKYDRFETLHPQPRQIMTRGNYVERSLGFGRYDDSLFKLAQNRLNNTGPPPGYEFKDVSQKALHKQFSLDFSWYNDQVTEKPLLRHILPTFSNPPPEHGVLQKVMALEKRVGRDRQFEAAIEGGTTAKRPRRRLPDPCGLLAVPSTVVGDGVVKSSLSPSLHIAYHPSQISSAYSPLGSAQWDPGYSTSVESVELAQT